MHNFNFNSTKDPWLENKDNIQGSNRGSEQGGGKERLNQFNNVSAEDNNGYGKLFKKLPKTHDILDGVFGISQFVILGG